MKIWKEFNSSHSSNITVIGKFEKAEDLDNHYEMIKEFILAAWTESYGSIEDFSEHWASKLGDNNIKYLQITDDEFMLGIDNDPDFERDKNTITVLSLRNDNLGGIIKLLRFAGASKIIIQ